MNDRAPTQHEAAMAAEQSQVLKSARRVTQAVNNELAKLGPSGRRVLLTGVHEGLAKRIAEDDKATRAAQQHAMRKFVKEAV
jgi:hypothetical protein